MAESDARYGETKTFHDPIHGTFTLDPLLVKIIDTPQFQRLRNVKQLGSVYFVYPGASHNRFEHSIGTAYLAGRVLRSLRDKYREKRKEPPFNDNDILCVEIAGLCHDLGQGPYSHMFENLFMPSINARNKNDEKWDSREWSCDMFQHLLELNKLKTEFKDVKDIQFIKELINPGDFSEEWKYEGREKEKSFLYEIVSNNRNGVDVDKWDYMARDGYHLGIPCAFDHNRFIQSLKILKEEDGLHHVFARDTECFNLYEMFNARCALHRRAYKHRVSNAIDHMICDAMLQADEVKKISACSKDPIAFTKLDDRIFEDILHSKEPNLERARVILDKIIRRDLYKHVTYIAWEKSKEKEVDERKILEEIAKKQTNLKSTDLALTTISIDYGKQSENPIEHFRFYSKEDEKAPRKMHREVVSSLIPKAFEDIRIQIFCKDKDKYDCALECAKAYCKTLSFLKRYQKETEPVEAPSNDGDDDRPSRPKRRKVEKK